MVNSREKGKRAELDVARLLRAHGFDRARRGQQYTGIHGDADVIGVPGIHIEVKHVEKLNLDEAYAQSVRDAKPGEIPVVIHRKSRQGFKVTMSLDDFILMYRRGGEGGRL